MRLGRPAVVLLAVLAVLTIVTAAAHAQLPRTGGSTREDDVRSLRPPPGKPLSAKEMFSILDSDGDGRIESGEWRDRQMLLFYLLDRNIDNVLSRDEVPSLPEEKMIAADIDQDGNLSGYDFNQALFTQFTTADANSDGAVDSAEFEKFLTGLRQP
jgi:Ca2+-binding EF-hand superfamily protein